MRATGSDEEARTQYFGIGDVHLDDWCNCLQMWIGSCPQEFEGYGYVFRKVVHAIVHPVVDIALLRLDSFMSQTIEARVRNAIPQVSTEVPPIDSVLRNILSGGLLCSPPIAADGRCYKAESL